MHQRRHPASTYQVAKEEGVSTCFIHAGLESSPHLDHHCCQSQENMPPFSSGFLSRFGRHAYHVGWCDDFWLDATILSRAIGAIICHRVDVRRSVSTVRGSAIFRGGGESRFPRGSSPDSKNILTNPWASYGANCAAIVDIAVVASGE